MKLQRLAWAYLLALIFPIVALASTPAQEAAEREQTYVWQSAVFEQMEAMGTADSLTAAAMLLPVRAPAVDPDDQAATMKSYMTAQHQSAGTRLRLLDRAASLEPDAADIASLALKLCRKVASCDVAKRAQNLHIAAPDDAGYLIPALIKAQKDSNEAQVSEILQTMAEASSLNSYYADARHRFQLSVNQSSTWPELPATVRDSDRGQSTKFAIISLASVSMYSVAGMPSFSTIDNACQENNTRFADRREACRQIGLALSHDDSILFTRIGLAFWRRAARNDADLVAAEQASRNADWRLETYTQAMMDDTIDSPEYFQSMLDHGGEVPSLLALLKQHDLPTLPPEGWVSRHERLERNQTVAPAPSSSARSGTP